LQSVQLIRFLKVFYQEEKEEGKNKVLMYSLVQGLNEALKDDKSLKKKNQVVN
jgi:hypothetical protein